MFVFLCQATCLEQSKAVVEQLVAEDALAASAHVQGMAVEPISEAGGESESSVKGVKKTCCR